MSQPDRRYVKPHPSTRRLELPHGGGATLPPHGAWIEWGPAWATYVAVGFITIAEEPAPADVDDNDADADNDDAELDSVFGIERNDADDAGDDSVEDDTRAKVRALVEDLERRIPLEATGYLKARKLADKIGQEHADAVEHCNEQAEAGNVEGDQLLERAAELSEILAKKCAKPARSRRRRSEDR